MIAWLLIIEFATGPINSLEVQTIATEKDCRALAQVARETVKGLVITNVDCIPYHLAARPSYVRPPALRPTT